MIFNLSKRNAIKYNPSDWKCDTSDYTKKKIQDKTVNETLDMICKMCIKNGLVFEFRNQTYKLDCFSKEDFEGVKVVFKDIRNSGTYAEYKAKDKTIYLDNSLRNDGLRCFAALYHEATHLIQNAAIKHIDEYEGNSPVYDYLTLIASEVLTNNIIGINSFGFKFDSKMYFSGDNFRKANEYLGIAIYMLQLSERTAKAVERKAYNYIASVNNITIPSKGLDCLYQNELEIAVNELNNCLGVEMSFDELCEKNDIVRLCIINQKSPPLKDDVSATLMYYVTVALKIETMVDIHTTDEWQILLDKYLNKKMIREVLGKAYSNEGKYFVCPDYKDRIDGIPYVNDMFDVNQNYSSVDLMEMSREEQQRNPLIIASAIQADGKIIFKELVGLKNGTLIKTDENLIIKDLDAFEKWYHSIQNTLAPKAMDLISCVLDKALNLNPPRFSHKAHLENFQRIKEKESVNQNIEVVNLKLKSNDIHAKPCLFGAPWEPSKKDKQKHHLSKHIDIER